MSIIRYPNIRGYWGPVGLSAVCSTMSVNRFEKIRQYLHINDDSLHSNDDLLHKIRPLITKLNANFMKVPMQQRLCIDEQMCSTKMASRFRQYMPAKPHKWGFKLFVLCDATGFAYSFEIYTGAGANVIPEDAPDFGAASNVVSRLSQKVPKNVNHIMYFDNFYTSVALMVYLRTLGIYSLGTVRRNRVKNCPLPTEKDLAQTARGFALEYTTNIQSITVSAVTWKDNKCVNLLSTYCGIEPFIGSNPNPTQATSKTVDRFDKKINDFVEIGCPRIIKEYNAHMGGVDLMDGLMGRYRIRMKTRKWSNRLLFHMIDMAMVNAYRLYRRNNSSDPQCMKMELAIFREQVAESLCRFRTSQNPMKGRPFKNTRFKNSSAPNPIAEIRTDDFGHWPTMLDRTGRKACRNAGCKSKTQIFCQKCKVNLCLTVEKNCFAEYHT